MELKKEVKRKHLLKIVNNLWMCNESTVASARSVPVCAGLLATPHCDPLWKAHCLVFWVAQSFIFINERFYNLSPVVKDSPNWKKFEKRKVLNFSSGQGSNGQNVGVSCPLSDVGRNPNMEQPKRRYMEKKMKKKEKTKHLYTITINT